MRHSLLFEILGSEAYQGRLLLHLDVGNHVIHGRVLVRLRQRSVLKACRLMGELMRRKRWRMLCLHGKRVLVGEVVSSQSMRIEAMNLVGWGDLTSMQSPFRGWQRQRCAQAEAEAGPDSEQPASATPDGGA